MRITALGQRFRLVEKTLDEGGGAQFQELIKTFAGESIWVDLEKRLPWALAYELAREIQVAANNSAEQCLRRGCQDCADMLLADPIPTDTRRKGTA